MKKTIQTAASAALFIFFSVAGFHASGSGIKMYMATDKDQYSKAEKVQFQVFLLNPDPGTNHTAFVELLDCRGNRLSKKLLPFNFNIATGEIDLPANYPEPFCILYSYIMHKDSVQSSCFKRIRFAGVPEKNGTQVHIDAFYEGNSFIAESPNNILLRCRDENQNPLSLKGRIVDAQKQIYAVFETNSQGYAKTRINPENNVPYFIAVTDPAGKESLTPLRKAQPAGITLNVETARDSITYSLISYSQANASLPDYRVEALMNGQVVYDASVSFQHGLSAISESMNRRDFPAGFILFRIVDKNSRIYAERIIYNDDTRAATSQLTIVDTVNKKEAKITLPAYISGKGYINLSSTPSNLHSDSDPFFLENTDNESISFNEQLIAAREIPGSLVPADESSNHFLSLSGTLLNSEKKPLRNKQVTLVLVQRNLEKKFLTAKTDATGNLQIDNLIFFDSVTVYYQLADKSAEKNDVFLDLVVTPSPTNFTAHLPGISLTCEDAGMVIANTAAAAADANNKTLQQVVVRSEKEKTESEKFEEKYTSGQMKKNNSPKGGYDFIKNPQTVDNITALEFIRGRIPGIKVMMGKDGVPELTGTFGGTVNVYLNDMELGPNSTGAIAGLLVRDVAEIKYYSTSFKPKQGGGDLLRDIKAVDAGDLLIYTKRDFTPDEKTKGLAKTVIYGYDAEKPYASVERAATSPSVGIFWKGGWDVQPGQVIYVTMPAGGEAVLTIEGLNNLMAPYRFTQKIAFK